MHIKKSIITHDRFAYIYIYTLYQQSSIVMYSPMLLTSAAGRDDSCSLKYVALNGGTVQCPWV